MELCRIVFDRRSLSVCGACCVAAIAATILPWIQRAHGAELPAQADRWQQEYAPAAATAPHVIALWQFSSGAERDDSSGHGYSLELSGATPAADGKFGGGLQSYPGWPVKDERHAAVAKSIADLSPAGAFSIDLWLKPSTDLPANANAHLLCKKYVSHHDYQLILSPEAAGHRRLQFNLGFGNDSESFFSDLAAWPADEWHHLAVTYDGAGTVRFFRDGEALGGQTVPGRRSISAGPLPLSIGDRTGSLYAGFAGVIDQVRICSGVRPFGLVRMELALVRRVYVRNEPHPQATVLVTNLQAEPLRGTKLTVSLSGKNPTEFDLPEILPAQTVKRALTLDTSLRPDLYDLRLEFRAQPAAGSATQVKSGEGSAKAPYHLVQTDPLRIVARPPPHRMPVVNWGVGGDVNILKNLPRLKQIGFTHCLGLSVDESTVWTSGSPIGPAPDKPGVAVAGVLDELLANDFAVLVSLSPGHTLERLTEQFRRVDRAGQPLPRAGIDGLAPRAAEFCEQVGTTVGNLYAPFPAFQGALIHSEVRDAAALSFGRLDRDAYRAATGNEIPDGVNAKWGVDYRSIKGFPSDRVVPDDDPLLAYLRWFWREGDGWPGLNSAVVRGLQTAGRSVGRTDLWTFHDPAVRVASVFGSGGHVDVISQWTYSYPEPIRIGLPTDELFAMARGAAHPQQVMKMTQLIWYRSQTAPIAAKAADVAPVAASPASAWDDHDPTAQYITIAPMHLREAFWTKISRPIQGIMYHGWESLVPADHPSAYRYTHPETEHELQRLVHEVVVPLGPMLRQIPAARHDVAFYESFAAQMLARRGAYGWSHSWTGDCYQVLQHAGLQADVLYDESISRFGLDGYKLLVIPDGDVLTRSVADAILSFQRRGGIVVADDRLAPAIKPDLTLPPLVRTKQADVDKARLLELAAMLKHGLKGKYQAAVDSSNLDVVVYRRAGSTGGGQSPTGGAADPADVQKSAASRGPGAEYVFVVNDRREYGSYVGRHQLVEESGRFSTSTISMRGVPAGATVYDLRTSRLVAATAGKDGLQWPVELGPCEGGLYLVAPEPLAALHVDVPAGTPLARPLPCHIEVRSARSTPVQAAVPLHVELRDPDGRAAEFSGYYAAVDGVLDLRFDIASNDLPGAWSLRVRDLASGLSAQREIQVTPAGRGP